MGIKYDKILGELRESDSQAISITPGMSGYIFNNYIESKIIDGNNASLNDVINILGTIVNELNGSSTNVKKHNIIIRGEVLADANSSQGIYLYNHLNVNMVIDNIEVVVGNSTNGNLKLNLYKSSGVNGDGIDNNATKIFIDDLDLSSGTYSTSSVPDYTILEPGRYLSLRVVNASGTLANDLTCIITYLG